MSKKTQSLSKKNVSQKAEPEENELSSSIIDSIDFESITVEELNDNIKSDFHFEEVFHKLQDLFMQYSDEMKTMDDKRQKTIVFLKAVHKEYKKNHPHDYSFPDMSDDMDENTIDDDMNALDDDKNDVDIYDEEPLEVIPPVIEEKIIKTTKPVVAKQTKKPAAKSTTKIVTKTKTVTKEPLEHETIDNQQVIVDDNVEEHKVNDDTPPVTKPTAAKVPTKTGTKTKAVAKSTTGKPTKKTVK